MKILLPVLFPDQLALQLELMILKVFCNWNDSTLLPLLVNLPRWSSTPDSAADNDFPPLSLERQGTERCSFSGSATPLGKPIMKTLFMYSIACKNLVTHSENIFFNGCNHECHSHVVTRVYEGFLLTDHQMRNGKISSSCWYVCQSLPCHIWKPNVRQGYRKCWSACHRLHA